MKLFAIYFISLVFPLTLSAQRVHLLIGTYTESDTSKGIYVYRFDLGTGEALPVSSIKAQNPSFLAISADRQFVYAVNENGNGLGAVSAFAYNDQRGTLSFLNRRLTNGDHPCHVATDSRGTHVIVANYSGGSLSVFPIGQAGDLGDMVQYIQYEGHGPDLQRQDAPHVHSSFFLPGASKLFVQDLGTDKINVYDFRPDAGGVPLMAAAQPTISTPPGGGPRHVTFSVDSRFMYVVQEMAATVLGYSKQGDRWEMIQEVPINEAGFDGNDGAADIKLSPDGRFLYASNRGEANTLAIYRVDGSSGMLTKVGNQPTLGGGPRNFTISPDGKFLLVANQQSDEVVVFERDVDTGHLRDTGRRINVASPVCLVFAGN